MGAGKVIKRSLAVLGVLIALIAAGWAVAVLVFVVGVFPVSTSYYVVGWEDDRSVVLAKSADVDGRHDAYIMGAGGLDGPGANAGDRIEATGRRMVATAMDPSTLSGVESWRVVEKGAVRPELVDQMQRFVRQRYGMRLENSATHRGSE